MSLEPNVEQSGADILLSTFESTTTGFSSFPARGNFCTESNYSSPATMSHKRTASCGQQRKVMKTRESSCPDFEQCVNAVVGARLIEYINVYGITTAGHCPPGKTVWGIIFSFHQNEFHLNYKS